MNDKIINILKDKNYVIPYYLMKKYKMLNIELSEFILLVYLINNKEELICDYEKLSSDLNSSKKDMMISIETLKNKGLIEIKIVNNEEGKLEELISLDLFYNKIFMDLIEEESSNESNIYTKFEEEFGRTLSPIEYELITEWINQKYSEDLILEALKEATLSGVSNLRYIDRILFEWSKKGIKNVDQARKNKEKFSKNNDTNIEVPDYDWLNNE